MPADYFKDLGSASHHALIRASDTNRDFGHDTANAALGRLSGDVATNSKSKQTLRLKAEDARAVVLAMEEMQREFTIKDKTRIVTHKTQENIIQYEIDCVRQSKAPDKAELSYGEFMKKRETLKYKLKVTLENSRTTELHIAVTLNMNGFYWVSVRGNPTSLLNSYNAHAVAIPGLGIHSERRLMLRVLFAVLRRIVRSTHKGFDWHGETRQRIKDLSFRLCPAQVFTYILPGRKSPTQLLGFLRAVFSVPYSNRLLHRLLHDDLGFEMQARGTLEGVQSLLFLFRKGGRIAWSVCLYDKLAKAANDAEMLNIDVGDESVGKFLSQALRVDVTVHEGGQREMQWEACINTREDALITAANYCRAISIMDKREGRSGKRFVHWLLDFVFGDLMKLWTLLAYVPSKLNEGRKLIEAYNADAAACFDEWREKGFEDFSGEGKARRRASFETFLINHAKRKVTRAIARKAHEILLSLKLDPDIPLRAYDAFYETTYAWDLPDQDRHRLAQAREAGDDKTVLAIQKLSRRNSVEINDEIRRSFVKMIKSAHTPANTLGGAEPAE